jgi:plastocyanin
MRRVHTRGAPAVPALLALALAACGSGTSNTSSGGSGGSGGEVTVTAHDFSFDAPSASASPGASVTVKFVNAGQTTQHSFTLDSGGQEVVADPGATQTLTFTAPSSGSIAFHCKFHSSMHGTISVGGAAGAGGSSSSSSSAGGYGYGGYTR